MRMLLRLLTGVVVLTGVCVPCLLQPGISPVACAGLPASVAGLENSSPSVIPIQIGLSGTISSGIIVDRLAPGAERTAFVGTSDGLYLVVGGSIHRFIYTPAPVADVCLVDDCTGDDTKEIVIYLASSYFAGVQCYDGATGVELWRSATTREALVADLGRADVQSLPIGLEPLPDVNSNGSEDIAALSAGLLCMLDGRTGERIWEFEANRLRDADTRYGGGSLGAVAVAGDVDGDGIVDLAVAGGGGFLGVISGKDGGLLLKERLAEIEPASDPGGHVVCFEVNGQHKAAVTLSGGTGVYLLDLDDGTAEWQTRLANAEIELSSVGDTTGDGVPEVLAFWKSYPQTSIVLNIVLLNGATGDTLWTREIAGSKSAEVTDLDGEKSILVPLRRQGAVERLAVLDLGNGETRQTLEVACATETSSLSIMSSDRWVAGFDDTSLLLVSNQTDLLCVSSQGEVMWYCPRVNNLSVQQGRFNEDSVTDLLLCSSRVLLAIDGSSYTGLWRHEVPYEALMSSGGMSGTKAVADLDHDGCDDVVSCQGSLVKVFSGCSGDLLVASSVGDPISSLDVMRNVDSVAFVAGTASGMSIVGPEGDVLWAEPYEAWDEGLVSSADGFLVLDDTNSDSISDLAILRGSRLVVALSSLTNGTLAFAAGWTVEYGGEIASGEDGLVADLDGDGIREIGLLICKGDSDFSSVVVSAASGQTLVELQHDGGLTLQPGCADFDGDGCPDSLAYWREAPTAQEGEEVWDPGLTPSGARLQIISGQDEAVLWQYDYDSPSDSEAVPAAAVSDLNGDGLPDLALTQIRDEDEVETLQAYDVRNDRVLREVALMEPANAGAPGIPAAYDSPGGPGGSIQEVTDLNGDGRRDLVILDWTLEGEWGGRGGIYIVVNHPLIVDLVNEQVLSRFLVSGSEVVECGDESTLGLVGSSGGFRLLNVANELQLVSPLEGSSHPSPLHIRWQGAGSGDVTQVFVDHVRNGLTYGQELTLPVAAGSHRVTIYSLDQWGKLQQQSVSVNVKGRPWVPVLACLALSVLVVAIFLPRLMHALERRSLRSSHGRRSGD